MQEYLYRCDNFQALTSDIMLLKFMPQSKNASISYSAGQYVEAVFDDQVLPLSIANSPSETRELEFHLRHNSYHPVAKQFLTALHNNKHVVLRGPIGNSTLDRATNASKIIMLAGGTGFTPFKALLEEALLLRQYDKQIDLIWGIRQPLDAYKIDLLMERQSTHSLFDFKVVLSEPENFPSWEGPVGLAHEYLAKCYPRFDKEAVFASGPYPMVKAAFELFTAQGLKPEQFICDMITSAISA